MRHETAAAGRGFRRLYFHIAASLGGFLATLLLITYLAELRARPEVSDERVKDEPMTLVLGEEPGDSNAAVFPLEEYVVHGDTRWEPLLRRWRDPAFVAASKGECRVEFTSEDPATTCSVEYTFTARRIDGAPPRHRVRHVRAVVRPGKSVRCREYVSCRLPEFLDIELPLPPANEDVVIRHRVLYDGRQPTNEEMREEIESLERRLAKPEPADFGTLPPPLQRMQRLLDLEKAQRLQTLLDDLERRETSPP